ncbi:phosphatase PAP2 family protein [Terracoccus sp. 273MFTsu3.1]|uniref:phosphatase PAP2 family protein n=1 Tax=Terracoccus sp. 273MFTsu3.1 TaxID=1172188 RepID=UPI00037CA02C|nr:phosphatase PAP2 family protein [Terracoccus sp. 273MFTsu3.1]
MSHRDRLRWAGAAVIAAAAFVLVALVSTRTGVGVSLDEAVRNWVLNELPGPLRQGLDRLARPLVIVVLAPTVLILALLALVRRGWRRAFAGVVIPAVSTVVALELRTRDVFGIGGDAFPSNHAAAGLGLLVGVAVVWPRPVTRRGLVALGVAAFCTALGNVTWYAHQPRDVLGSALLVVAVAAATFAVVGGDSPNLAAEVRVSRRTAGATAGPVG